MILLFIKLVIPFLLGVAAYVIPPFFTGTKEHGGVNPKDDERSQFIKQKAIAGSWTFMLLLFVFITTLDFFKIGKGPFGNFQFGFEHQTLFYLIILIASYFVYYFIYSKRLSSNEK